MKNYLYPKDMCTSRWEVNNYLSDITWQECALSAWSLATGQSNNVIYDGGFRNLAVISLPASREAVSRLQVRDVTVWGWASVKLLDTGDLGEHLCLLRCKGCFIRIRRKSFCQDSWETTRNFMFGALLTFTPSVSSLIASEFVLPSQPCDNTLIVCTVRSESFE